MQNNPSMLYPNYFSEPGIAKALIDAAKRGGK